MTKQKKKTQEKNGCFLLLSLSFSRLAFLSLSNDVLRRQAKENNQNNNSNEKRKRDGIVAAGCKFHDELD